MGYRVKASRGGNREGRNQRLDAGRRFRDFGPPAFILGGFFAAADFFDFDREVVEEPDLFFAARRGECLRGVRGAGEDASEGRVVGVSSWLTIAAALSANSCVVATTLPAAWPTLRANSSIRVLFFATRFMLSPSEPLSSAAS
jgi:hypothetical protein